MAALKVFDANAIQGFQKLARMIVAIFDGDVKGPLNLENFVNGKSNAARERSISSLGLSNRIRNTFGLDWLNSTQLNPYRAPAYGWPGVYVNRAWGTQDPCMELLLATTLKETTSNERIWLSRRRSYPYRWHSGLPTFDGRIVKEFLRGSTTEAIAKSVGLRIPVVRLGLAAFPDLKRRYLLAKKKATAERHKKAVLHYIDNHPNCAKVDIRHALPAANNYLKRGHREWWNLHIGNRLAYGPQRENGTRPRLGRRARIGDV